MSKLLALRTGPQSLVTFTVTDDAADYWRARLADISGEHMNIKAIRKEAKAATRDKAELFDVYHEYFDTLLDRLAAIEAKCAAMEEENKRMRNGCEASKAFIENLRVPQNESQAGVQIFIADGVLRTLSAALAKGTE